MRVLVAMVVGILVLGVALLLVGFVTRLVSGAVHLASGLFGLALMAAVLIFVIGLVRRLIRV